MSDRFSVEETAIEGLKVVTRQAIEDERGFLERLYSADEMAAVLGSRRVLQINRTRTLARATVRGMHYQSPPHSEMKLVMCLRGAVFDVAVDVRQGSPTFLSWHSEVLEDSGPTMLLIPEGFAHGLQTLEDNCEMLYFHTAAHEPSAERGLNPTDPALAIEWPEAITEMSSRDASTPMLTTDFKGIAL
jgi:dTDP-4-dehydrorhamnose 3,5-epimerase